MCHLGVVEWLYVRPFYVCNIGSFSVRLSLCLVFSLITHEITCFILVLLIQVHVQYVEA